MIVTTEDKKNVFLGVIQKIKKGLGNEENELVIIKAKEIQLFQNEESKQSYTFLCWRHVAKQAAKKNVYAIALNTRSSIIGVFEISRGTVAASLLSAREILIRMLIVGATHFLICHNHPSGHLQPSKYDVDSTKNIVNAGRTIGIPLVDHLIIGDGRYVSLLEEYGKELFG